MTIGNGEAGPNVASAAESGGGCPDDTMPLSRQESPGLCLISGKYSVVNTRAQAPWYEHLITNTSMNT
eukprot:349899-Chlamydomonas_euryale.AAC.3